MNQLGILCFISIARTQSFSSTARELRISQQAVSKHIRALEEELGFPLFLRSYQTVRLTKAGEQMLSYFVARENLTNELYERFRSSQNIRPLRIACTQWLSFPLWFRKAAADFGKLHPGIQLLCYDLNTEEMAAALQNDEIDLLLTTRYAAEYLPVAWNATPVGNEPIMLIGSYRIDYNFNDCSMIPFFATSAGEVNEQGVLARVQRECEQSNIYPRHIEVCPNMGSVFMNILACGGLTLGISIPSLAHAKEFISRPTGRSATVVLCRPFRNKRAEVTLFEEYLVDTRRDAQ